MSAATALRSLQDDVPVPPLVEPPASLDLGTNIRAYWTGTTVALTFSDDVYLPDRNPDGERPLDAVLAIRAFSEMGFARRNVEAFRDAWQAWTHNPSHYGAIPMRYAREPQAAAIPWVSPNATRNHIIPDSPFGMPIMRFNSGNWCVSLLGFDHRILAETPWTDTDRLAELTATLGNIDYWCAAAALAYPEDWERAKGVERNRIRAAHAQTEREEKQRAAAQAYSAPDLAVSTRTVARLLRTFAWNTENSTHNILSVDMTHCDIPTPAGKPARAAEHLTLHWHGSRTSLKAQREVTARLREHLAPRGYEPVLARSGHIYITRDKATLAAHIGAISRGRNSSRIMTVY